MLIEWLGPDQTIDLGQWAQAVGMRRAFLESLPDLAWSASVVILSGDGTVHEVLHLSCEARKLRLRFLPPRDLGVPSPLSLGPGSLTAHIQRLLPAAPPMLCTMVLDHDAASQALLGSIISSGRAEQFRARLRVIQGQHWRIEAVNPLVEGIAFAALTYDLRPLQKHLAGLDGLNLVFHRAAAPAARRGGHFAGGQFKPLAQDELVSVSNTIWIDERLIGEGLALAHHLLSRPRQRSAHAVYSGLASLLRRGYLRFPHPTALRCLRWLPPPLGGVLIRRWLRLSRHTVSLPSSTAHAKPEIALYVQVNEPVCSASRPDSPASGEELRGLLEVIAQHPDVRFTIGWTRGALRKAMVGDLHLLALCRMAMERGQLEIAHADAGPPLPLIECRQLVETQLRGWHEEAQAAGLQATAFAPAGGRLTPGWGDLLRGGSYRHVVVSESELRRSYPPFDTARPIRIEGWPVVGIHQELTRVLSLDLSANAVEAYLQRLAADCGGRAVAARLDLAHVSDVLRLARLVQHAIGQGCSLAPLSRVADASVQGTIDSPPLQGLAPWTADEQNRRLNSLVTQTWELWRDIRALHRQRAPCEAGLGPPSAPTAGLAAEDRAPQAVESPGRSRLGLDIDQLSTLERAVLETQSINRRGWLAPDHEREASIEEVRKVRVGCRSLATSLLAGLRPRPTLPPEAVGYLRILPRSDHAGDRALLRVGIRLSKELQPSAVHFVHGDMPVASQFAGCQNGLASFWVAADVHGGGATDILVLQGSCTPPAEALHITTQQLCNAWLVALLDSRGQVTSIRYQGHEHLQGPGNHVRGTLLETGAQLRPELVEPRMAVTARGPLVGTVTVHQSLTDGVELVRHVRINQLSPLLEFVTDLRFQSPRSLTGSLVVGEFDLVGQEVSWALPLEAGTLTLLASEIPPLIFAAEDTIDIRTRQTGIRYLAHRDTTRTYNYSGAPTPGGARVGLIASMPAGEPDCARLTMRSGLGFPGHVYAGRYLYRHALLPLGPDVAAHAAAFTRAPLWAFYHNPRVRL